MTNKLEITNDPETLDDIDSVVCMRLTVPLLMPDNKIARCSACDAAVQHRPHVPKGVPKICWECAQPQIVEAASRGEFHGVITPHTAREVAIYLKRKKQ